MRINYILKTLLFALLYVLLAKAGLLLALDEGFASVVWPGSGIALSFLLINGNKMWPAIALGSFTINFISGGSFGFSFLVCVGNTLEAVAAYTIIKQYGDPSKLFEKLKSTIGFLFASLAASVLSAVIGGIAYALFHNIEFKYFETIGTWWLGDLTSFLLIVPAVILFNKTNLSKLLNSKIVISFAMLIMACYFTFFITYNSDVIPKVLIYTLFMFPLVAALTQNRLLAILHVLIISLCAISGTIFGKGPFIFSELNSSLILLQSFISVLSIVALIVSVDIKEKKLIENKLSILLNEKDLLISEIHHRVKNNLSVVSSLLFLQGETIENEEVKQKFEQTQLRIKTIALVHEKLYKESNIKTVEFSSYIKALSEMIHGLYESSTQNINLILELEKLDLPIEKALPLGLIVNELLTNSFKHAFAGRPHGEIEIKFQLKEKGYFLQVKDNGAGLKKAIINDPHTLGFTLVNALAEQINAEVSVKSEEGAIHEFYFN